MFKSWSDLLQFFPSYYITIKGFCYKEHGKVARLTVQVLGLGYIWNVHYAKRTPMQKNDLLEKLGDPKVLTWAFGVQLLLTRVGGIILPMCLWFLFLQWRVGCWQEIPKRVSFCWLSSIRPSMNCTAISIQPWFQKWRLCSAIKLCRYSN